MKAEIIPAILVYSRAELLQKIHRVKPFVKSIQIDVMDGVFVKNITLDARHLGGLPEGVSYEFHWMVEQPERSIRMVKGNHLHIVHVETLKSIANVEAAVKSSGGRLGVAINPETPLEKALPYAKKAERVLVMTVNPGYSGQKYLEGVEDKIRELRRAFKDKEIEVDGGINKGTAYRAAAAGADKIAAASAIFNSFSIEKAINELRESAEKGCGTWAKKGSG